MRNSSILFILSALVVGIFFTGCKKFQGPSTVITNPNPLEVHGDSIEYTTKVKIAPKSGMKKKGIYTGSPSLRNGSDSFKSDNMVIQGPQNPNVKKQGAELSKKYKVAYSDRMNGGTMRMDNTYQKNAKKAKTLKEVTDSENVAKCCITTSRMVWDGEYYLLTAKDRNEYRKVVPLSLEAKFNFPKNIDKIQADDYNKSDITAIGEFINKRLPATKITIVGFASPEGSLKRNVELSVNRSKEVQAWLMDQLKKAGYTQYLDSTFFAISTTSEDWDGFKQNVKSSPKFGEYSSQIFEIVSSGITEDEKESKIMALVGGARNPEVEALLSPLRRATIVMEGLEPRRTDNQIDSIGEAFVAGKVSGNIKDIYEKEEWLYAIGRMDNWKNKKPHLAAFVQAYPSDYRGLNDYGAVLASEGSMDEAMKNLESAASNKRGDNAILNNTGVVQRVKGKRTEARRSFESSLSAQNTPEAAFNLGVVLAGQAAYAQAIDRFNSARSLKGSDYNIGLCKLMMDDKSGARSSFESSARAYPDYTQGYYMLAVTGVRMSDKDLWTLNLKKAVDGNRRFGDMAKTDLEFDKVREMAEFKAIVR